MSGEYVRLYRGLFDDPEFLAMPAPARLLFLVLKGILGRIGIGVLYFEQIQSQTGLTDVQIQKSLRLLQKSPKWWVKREGYVYWIRNDMMHENVTRKNEIQQIVMKNAGLPPCDLVREFRSYYADHAALSTIAPCTPAGTRGGTRAATRAESKAKHSRECLTDSLAANQSPDRGSALPEGSLPADVASGAEAKEIIAEAGISTAQPRAPRSSTTLTEQRAEVERRRQGVTA